VLTIARREMAAYFNSPIFWVLSAAFLAFFGLVFQGYIRQSELQGAPAPQADMSPLLGLVGVILLFVTPLLAMRLLSEEQRSGTLELLMTAPVRDWQVVAGKWLAALTVLVVMLGMTLFHVGIMQNLAQDKGLAFGPLAASYLGLLLLGAALLALGVLTSALTQNQVVAAFLGIMLVMVLWFLPFLAGSESTVGQVLAYLGLTEHYNNFGQGIVDSRDVIYFLSVTLGALYLATRILESRRWR
jgi:ABC-2 type transport system permease protein